MTPARVVERTLSNVRPGASGCVESCYATGSHGYAQVGWHSDGKTTMRLAHRVAWEASNGLIPPGLTVDHICRNRICVNVDHMRLLSRRVNATLNEQATRTHCPKGHEYTHGNTRYITRSNGRLHRKCIACQNEANRRRNGRQEAEA